MKRATALISLSIAGLLAGASAQAATITGTGDPAADPALSGGTQIDFEAAGRGGYGSLSLNGVTFSAPGGNLQVQSTFGGDYNTTGQYLDNNDGNYLSQFNFDFNSTVSAFGFNLGAHDVSWVLTAFAGDTVVDSLTISPIGGSNAGQYYGLSGAGITSARLTSTGSDWVLLDNFTFAPGMSSAVPEPGTWAMMLLGFGATGFSMRRQKKVRLLHTA